MLTVRQTADILNVSDRKVYEYIDAKKIHAMRYDGRGPWRVFPDSVASFLGIASFSSPASARKKAQILREDQLARARLGR